MRGLVESNALVGKRGAYRLAANASHLRVPATVHAIIAARIDRLAPGDKAVLQVAAVIGKTIPWTLLIAVAGLGEAELHAALGRLHSAEFIVEGQLFPTWNTPSATPSCMTSRTQASFRSAVARFTDRSSPPWNGSTDTD